MFTYLLLSLGDHLHLAFLQSETWSSMTSNEKNLSEFTVEEIGSR